MSQDRLLSFHRMLVSPTPPALGLVSGDVAKLDMQTSNTLVLGLKCSPFVRAGIVAPRITVNLINTCYE